VVCIPEQYLFNQIKEYEMHVVWYRWQGKDVISSG
jgi:hypothetical protein